MPLLRYFQPWLTGGVLCFQVVEFVPDTRPSAKGRRRFHGRLWSRPLTSHPPSASPIPPHVDSRPSRRLWC